MWTDLEDEVAELFAEDRFVICWDDFGSDLSRRAMRQTDNFWVHRTTRFKSEPTQSHRAKLPTRWRKCLRCGEKTENEKYCSHSCGILSLMIEEDGVCELCKTPFRVRRNKNSCPTKYCSSACKYKAANLRRSGLCATCGKRTKGVNKYCGMNCRRKWRSNGKQESREEGRVERDPEDN
jgi:hypothetical protein